MFVQCTVHTSSSLFFLTNKPFFQKFYLLLPYMGGGVQKGGVCEKKFSCTLRAVKFRTPLFKFLNTPLDEVMNAKNKDLKPMDLKRAG